MPNLIAVMLRPLLRALKPAKPEASENLAPNLNPFAYGTREALEAALWCNSVHIARDSLRLRANDNG